MTTPIPATGPRSSPARLAGALARVPRVWFALAALLLFNIAFTSNFLSLQTFNVNLTQVATIVIVALGMTLVVATGGIDLSVGSLMAIAGTLAPLLFLHVAGPAGLLAAFVLPLLAATLCGLFNGWLVTRWRIQAIVATLVLYIAGRGIAQVMTNGQLQTFSNPGFQWIGTGRVLGVPVQVVLMLVLVAVVAWVLRATLFGRQILAVGGNERAARLAGVPVQRVKLAVYALSGVLAGLAGLVAVAINSSSDANLVGAGVELEAIAAVAVGGTLLSGGHASISGTLAGAMFIQLVRYTLLAHGVTDASALVVKSAIIVLAVYLQRRH